MQTFKLATVTATGSGGVKVRFEGETQESGKAYARLTSCSPAIGNRVLLAPVSGSYVVLGIVTR